MPISKYPRGINVFDLHTGCNITRRSCTALPIPSSVIDRVNQIGLTEGQPSLIKLYYCKVNTIVDVDTKIAGVDQALDITGLYYDNDESHQEQYDTTDIDIGKDEQQYEQEDHKEDHNSHEHNDANISPPQDDKHDDLQ